MRDVHRMFGGARLATLQPIHSNPLLTSESENAVRKFVGRCVDETAESFDEDLDELYHDLFDCIESELRPDETAWKNTHKPIISRQLDINRRVAAFS